MLAWALLWANVFRTGYAPVLTIHSVRSTVRLQAEGYDLNCVNARYMTFAEPVSSKGTQVHSLS